MGFVNCEWALKGQLKSNARTNIYADGQTYDQKLYTFEEINYKKEFISLNIFIKRAEYVGIGSRESNQEVPALKNSLSS